MKALRFEAELEVMSRAEAAAWKKIDQSFQQAKVVGPQKGFARRWLNIQRLEELAERKRREAWLAFGNASALLAILGVVVMSFWPAFSQPVALLAGLLDSLLEGLTLAIVTVGVGLSILGSFPLAVWMVVAIAFFGLVALWASLFSRFSAVYSSLKPNSPGAVNRL